MREGGIARLAARSAQGREGRMGAPIGLRLGQTIDERIVAELLEALQCEGRAQ
jgi:hypothetical protein